MKHFEYSQINKTNKQHYFDKFKKLDFGHHCLVLYKYDGTMVKWSLTAIDGFLVRPNGLMLECNELCPTGSGIYFFIIKNTNFIYEKLIKSINPINTRNTTKPSQFKKGSNGPPNFIYNHMLYTDDSSSTFSTCTESPNKCCKKPFYLSRSFKDTQKEVVIDKYIGILSPGDRSPKKQIPSNLAKDILLQRSKGPICEEEYSNIPVYSQEKIGAVKYSKKVQKVNGGVENKFETTYNFESDPVYPNKYFCEKRFEGKLGKDRRVVVRSRTFLRHDEDDWYNVFCDHSVEGLEP